MKFGRELNEAAVPEWRAKYLDYKQGKKKIKAVGRALRNAESKSPGLSRKPPFSTTLAGGPVSQTLRASLGPHEHVSDEQQHRPRAGDARPQTIPPPNERSPLRSANGAPQEPPGRPGVMRYGSIIGSLPRDNEETSPLERTRSSSGRWQGLSDRASSLELPAPAIGPHRSDSLATSAATQERQTRFPTHRQNSMPDPSPTQGPASAIPSARRAGFLETRRTNSESRTLTKVPLVRRMLSSFDPRPSPGRWRQEEIMMGAYAESDLRNEDFFNFLNGELAKIDAFYEAKEKEATKRLDVLREQLHFMRNRRLEELEAIEQHQRQQDQHDDAAAAAAAAAAAGDVPNARFLPVPRASNAMARRISLAVEHVDQALDRVKPNRFGKTSKAMGELGSPVMNGEDQARRDYSRRPQSHEVSYRNAKRKLKVALSEYYRGLELLKSYAMTNRTAFRKILKKYDKTVGNSRGQNLFMQGKVNQSRFVKSDLVDQHMQAVEDLYSRYFERGSRKAAVNKLRAKAMRPREFNGSVWRQGVLATAGCIFGIQGLVHGIELLSDPRHGETSFLLQIYAGYFLMLFLVALFVLDCMLFTRAHVNYQFIFEFDPRSSLDWRQLSEMPSLFAFLLGLIVWFNFNRFGGDAMYVYWPLVLIGLSVLIFFAPLPVFYPKSRLWFAFSHWRLLWGGVLFPVEFRDFFLGDMYCSQTYAMGNIELFFCLYAKHWTNAEQCNSSSSRSFGFLQTVPGIWRAVQCLRRYRDTRNFFPHMVNFGKYTFTILGYMSLSLWRINRTYELLALFIITSSINSIYCSIWDVFMDWSLGDTFGARHKFLRKTLAYKHAWFYYAAMVIDPILRFNWVFYVIFKDDRQHSSIVSFAVSFSEVMRRGLWTVFRVENEHCTNVGRFRASRDTDLPYKLHGAADEEEEEEEEEEQTSASPRSSEDQSQGQTTPRIQARQPTSTTPLSRHTSRTTGADVEGQSGRDTLRSRRTDSTSDTPVARALRKIGSTVASAHAQDFERKKKVDQLDEDEEDDDDDEDDDEEDVESANGLDRP